MICQAEPSSLTPGCLETFSQGDSTPARGSIYKHFTSRKCNGLYLVADKRVNLSNSFLKNESTRAF